MIHRDTVRTSNLKFGHRFVEHAGVNNLHSAVCRVFCSGSRRYCVLQWGLQAVRIDMQVVNLSSIH
jgi:hypothetical protein